MCDYTKRDAKALQTDYAEELQGLVSGKKVYSVCARSSTGDEHSKQLREKRRSPSTCIAKLWLGDHGEG
ncbi:hypothetical protein Y1Q_0019392 [Alligator mississippiensis]|uniref:Uncharacterized protein n=1 Tax=Alligator mississippiensis TaxID=8496 RepID=A0A151MR31_ALLMI|nr:hypothetical protein Y1Q_0019392 [Alligator mississippiensis]